MGKGKEHSREEQDRRAKVRELLQLSGVNSMENIQSLLEETIAEFMEDGLETKLTEELGYSKYDYENKETENSRNGHSSKKLRTSFGAKEKILTECWSGSFSKSAAHTLGLSPILCKVRNMA